MNVYIIGGGPTGLALADGLSTQTGIKTFVFERDMTFGGLAKTIEWGTGNYHDLGPHKIFSLDTDLLNRVKGYLPPDQWITRKKISSIYINNSFIPYPPSPFSLLSIFGISDFISIMFDFAHSKFKYLHVRSEPSSFQDDLTKRVGNKLFELLFKPIALKLWDEPDLLDIKLSRNRVKTPTLKELIFRIFNQSSHNKFEASEFIYPKAGLSRLWNAIESRLSNNSCSLFPSCCINKICVQNKTIKSFSYMDPFGKEVLIHLDIDDYLFSTIPIHSLLTIIEGYSDTEIASLINNFMILNDLILVFLRINNKNAFPDSWIFIPDSQLIYHRISEQESFDPDMTPDGSIICCEIMSNRLRDFSNVSDKIIVDQVINDLHKMGYKFTITDSKIHRLKSSYPIYVKGIDNILDKTLSYYDSIRNFRTIGRQGSFNYIGTLDSMDIGYGSARWLINHRGTGRESIEWINERKRTGNYPVLD